MHIQSYEENYKSNFIFRKYTEEEYNWQKIIKDKIEARIDSKLNWQTSNQGISLRSTVTYDQL